MRRTVTDSLPLEKKTPSETETVLRRLVLTQLDAMDRLAWWKQEREGRHDPREPPGGSVFGEPTNALSPHHDWTTNQNTVPSLSGQD